MDNDEDLKTSPPQRTTTDGKPPRPGHENAPTPAPIRPDGQAEAYWILSAEERAKGFVRPVRRTYKHVGIAGPRFPLRDLTDEEKEIYGESFAKFEPYPESAKAGAGFLWSQEDLDRVGKGCGGVTTMSEVIAQTYARQPSFYGSTFCVQCGTHLPVGREGEFVWVDSFTGKATTERVGT